MATLLVEIGCEELPASSCRAAAEQLPALVRKHLGVDPSAVHVGPRRLAVVVADVPERAPDEARRGPAESVAFGADGTPTKAGEGFARSAGLTVAELERRDGHVWAQIPGAVIADTLPERVRELVGGIAFAKPMAWRTGGMRFSRPIRWLCVKLGERTIDVELDGLRSGGVTYGHRFTHGALEVPAAGGYLEILRAAAVEPDASERRRLIVEGLDALGSWSDPAGKLDEVVHLVESPTVLEGTFAEKYLALPERVVVTAMQSHQRYFSLGGTRFAFVANGGEPSVVRAGNERVLEGRLEDASFTFERDVAVGIEGLSARLGSITFVAKVGSFAEKTARLERLVAELGGGEDALTAARLAKADQAAELVREFADLEGHIGAQYARLAGHSEAVCSAIEEQYLPDAAGGPIPATPAGRILAAAEKIDNLAVAFSLGNRPSGSRDPYGLRRAAIGLCRLAIEGELELDVARLVERAVGLLGEQGAGLDAGSTGGAAAEVDAFVVERLEGMLDVPVELVRAAARATSGRDLGSIAARARALAALPADRRERVRTVYARAERIVAKAGDGNVRASVDEALLADDAERGLWQAFRACEEELATPDGFDAAFASVEHLAEPLERFFDDVLVMAGGDLQVNRITLLATIRDRIRGHVGDLSQLPG